MIRGGEQTLDEEAAAAARDILLAALVGIFEAGVEASARPMPTSQEVLERAGLLRSLADDVRQLTFTLEVIARRADEASSG